MAGDLENFKRTVLRKLAASYGVSYEELDEAGSAPAVRNGEWYDRIRSTLDSLPEDGWLYVSRFQLPGHPARYVWVDRHRRVWRADDYGRLRVSEALR